MQRFQKQPNIHEQWTTADNYSRYDFWQPRVLGALDLISRDFDEFRTIFVKDNSSYLARFDVVNYIHESVMLQVKLAQNITCLGG